MLSLSEVCEKIRRNEYVISKHGDDERMNDNISLNELEEAILNGRILESYPDSGRGESCLIAGFSESGKPIHSVIGERNKRVVIVTVYIPKPPKFKNIYERGA
ncbi:MAG: DUF4258 domain-containing protein [Ignavibacteriales bacterium]|nr:DUF4258 domain-containing protein [Ignavibacteriales bacterium]